MRKSFVVLLNVGFWACYVIVILIMLLVYYRSSVKAEGNTSIVWNAFGNISIFAMFPSFISYLLFYHVLFPRYLQQGKIFRAIIAGLLISVGAAVIGYIVLRYFIETGRIVDMDEGGKYGRSTAVRVIIIMTVIGIIFGMVALVIKGFITWFNEIKLKEALREKNHEMEMALIKSQIDPHLLFNTINNIDTLILRDPVEASNYLNKLSDIMRFVLYETGADKILLSQEIEYMEKYIALQKIRTANESYVHFTVDGMVGGKRIAPMVFIPFIENAFKHTNNKKLIDAITIRILIREGTVQLVCENKYDSKSVKQPNGGLGNELVQKRLDLIYNGKHTLTVNKGDERYSVNLTIPYE